ncbi:hypothetical protein Ana3638_05930 [Anaerocolumna sedimenticola]|uniref:Uncharacterized protein n=1 Tax=Anaerocolumna sedimenticola TaxID=2696063 RepID=A0A6P1TJ87_9FIRM|nr:hypothetical protein [Anaerocolumna sedimenticola]QHQ60367.1 hypothetical protein Ana3638_05930 [Anaerocolumna sedimenticola]
MCDIDIGVIITKILNACIDGTVKPVIKSALAGHKVIYGTPVNYIKEIE